MRAIAARFSGVCAEDCGEPIRAGDEITTGDRLDGQWRHATCTPSASTPPRERPVCPACWTVHAGECT